MLLRVEGDASTLDAGGTQSGGGDDPGSTASAHLLILAWSATEPGRIGEAIRLPGDARVVFGRGSTGDRGVERGLLSQCRPGVPPSQRGPIDDPFVSRDQLELTAHPAGVAVCGIGRRPILVADRPVRRAIVRAGETLEVKGRLLFLCAVRPEAPASSARSAETYPFGEADRHGIVGESLAAWDLRERLAFCARRDGHVLLLGPSGSGKELAAQALHDGSSRASKTLVARNAATFPSGLVDAELFGSAANYPNAGMPERPGLMGAAEGSTLFLDEIGELPESLQAHLLRVLDEAGEYQRLGDARRRKADVRLVAATNRPVEHLKADLAARFRLRLALPGLDERVEDIPLLARNLLRRAAARDRELGERFFEGWDGRRGEPRIALALTRALLARRYTTHVRELDRLLWISLTTSKGGVAELTPELRRELGTAATYPAPAAPPAGRSTPISEAEIRAALANHGGVKERVWRELGLPSRYALRRLFAKYGIKVDADGT
jgi:two-component system nitrogen regulation response regulator GlnG/two-component system response regulator HydG